MFTPPNFSRIPFELDSANVKDTKIFSGICIQTGQPAMFNSVSELS